MKIKEDAVVENEKNMRQFIEGKLKEEGFSRSHNMKDYFKACRIVVSPTVQKFAKKTEVSQMAYRMEASMMIMDYIDPLA